MNDWSPMLDTLIVILPFAGMAFGWMVRAEKADRDCKRAYRRGYQQALSELMRDGR